MSGFGGGYPARMVSCPSVRHQRSGEPDQGRNDHCYLYDPKTATLVLDRTKGATVNEINHEERNLLIKARASKKAIEGGVVGAAVPCERERDWARLQELKHTPPPKEALNAAAPNVQRLATGFGAQTRKTIVLHLQSMARNVTLETGHCTSNLPRLTR